MKSGDEGVGGNRSLSEEPPGDRSASESVGCPRRADRARLRTG